MFADNGRLAILGLTPEGQPREGLNHGTKSYHWQIIRPRARQTTGDQRINPFGIGGEIEIRSALLTQKLPITGPQLHSAWARIRSPTWPGSSGPTVQCALNSLSKPIRKSSPSSG